MKNGKCPKCDSLKIMPNLPIGQITSPVLHNSPSLSIKYSKFWDDKLVKAYVCSECGYTELYVDKPDGMWEKHQKENAKQK